MEFANPKHQDVFKRVRTYLQELFEEKIYHDPETGHFYVSYGSTVIEISVEPYKVDGSDDAIMIAMAYCVQGVEVDDDLLRALLELNHTLPFGSFSLVGDDIFFSHALLGETLERSNVLTALAAVADVSDEYDDRIVEKFGGERALDRIRHTGGMKQRRDSIRRPASPQVGTS